MERCAKCGKELRTFSRTAYGENRCLDCFDDYLMTDKGKVEYLIGIVKGELDIKDYDADFLGHVAVCWNKYKEQLNISVQEIITLEEQAEILGIL
jgi:DNA-directed RNA polymerase subunit RPC12/RpoP